MDNSVTLRVRARVENPAVQSFAGWAEYFKFGYTAHDRPCLTGCPLVKLVS